MEREDWNRQKTARPRRRPFRVRTHSAQVTDGGPETRNSSGVRLRMAYNQSSANRKRGRPGLPAVILAPPVDFGRRADGWTSDASRCLRADPGVCGSRYDAVGL